MASMLAGSGRYRRLQIAIILAGFAIRVWDLGRQELRGDEAFGYFFSQQRFGEIVAQTVALGEPHPIASYFVQALWQPLAAPSEFWVRLPAAWFGTLAVALSIPIALFVTRQATVSVVASMLTAISPYAIWHSQDARMYSMSLALTAGATALVAAWWWRQRWRLLSTYAVLSWLALHTHYFAGYVLVAHAVYVSSATVLRRREWRQLWQFYGAQLAVLIGYLPWLVAIWKPLLAYTGNGDSPPLAEAVRRSTLAMVNGMTVPPWPSLWFGVGASAFLVGAWTLLRRSRQLSRHLAWLVIYCAALPILLTWFGAKQRPIFDERYLLAAAVPVYVVFAGLMAPIDVRAGRSNRSRSFFLLPAGWADMLWLGRALLVAAIVVGMLGGLWRDRFDPTASKTRGWRELAEAIVRMTTSMPADSVRIAQNFPDPTLWFYYQGGIEHVVLPPSPSDEVGAMESVRTMAERGVLRVVLPLQPAINWDSDGIAVRALASHYTHVLEMEVGVWTFATYARPPEMLKRADYHFENGVRLSGYAIDTPIVARAGIAVVHLAWNPENSEVATTDKVFIHLVDARGTLIAQRDELLIQQVRAHASGVASYGILIPESAAVGEYRLLTGLYDPIAAESGRYRTADGREAIELGTIAVVK